jgi:hypothetical protein
MENSMYLRFGGVLYNMIQQEESAWVNLAGHLLRIASKAGIAVTLPVFYCDGITPDIQLLPRKEMK